MKRHWIFVLAGIAAVAGAAAGQTRPAPGSTAPRTQLVGNITSVDSGANQILLRTDKGETFTLATSEKTVVIHVPPGETDVKKGTKMPLAKLGAGDRVVAFVREGGDGKTFQATSLVVRTKADLDLMAQKELEDWRKRGTVGTVSAVDPAARTVTVKVGQRTVVVEASEKTEYRRYSLDSAKPGDAKPSSLAEVKVGDQVNVLGDKNEAGTSVKAERIFAGTFRQLAATIVSIDAAAGEMKVTDLATRKPLVIRVHADSTMKKLPEMMARMLARRYQPAEEGGGPARGAGAQPGAGPGGPSRGPRGGGDIHQMLERAPAVAISDLKAGDAIMVSTTMGSDPGRVTVIMLLAGVEPLLTASPTATRDIMSGWNLGGGGGGEATQ